MLEIGTKVVIVLNDENVNGVVYGYKKTENQNGDIISVECLVDINPEPLVASDDLTETERAMLPYYAPNTVCIAPEYVTPIA